MSLDSLTAHYLNRPVIGSHVESLCKAFEEGISFEGNEGTGILTGSLPLDGDGNPIHHGLIKAEDEDCLVYILSGNHRCLAAKEFSTYWPFRLYHPGKPLFIYFISFCL